MRLLVIADRPCHADPAELAAGHGVDVVVCLGDLQASWVETLESVRLPKVGVYGNHDHDPYMTRFGIENAHLCRVDVKGGLSFCGFEGCVTYPRSGGGPCGPTYTQRKAAKLIRKLPRADILICHCPPEGVNDDHDDAAHTGFTALRRWVLKNRPRLLLHGHTYPQPGKLVYRLGDTRVIYVHGTQIVDVPRWGTGAGIDESSTIAPIR